VGERVVSRVIDAVRRIPGDLGAVLACSGGADSTALALAFSLAIPPAQRGVTLAHVNHHLRGDESDRDQAFVEQLAHRLGLPIAVGHRPIEGDSAVEERARAARYEWLHSIAAGRPLVTAHTKDDQAETVLHRIIRGTGIAGLAGIGDRPGVVRPFLDLGKQELIDFLAARGQDWREDSSNADRRYTRNRLRHDVLPLLRSINPHVDAALVALGRHAREWQELAGDLARDLLTAAERPRAGASVVLALSPLQGARPLIVREMFRAIWQREGWPRGDMTAEHWQRLGRLEPGDYPGRVRMERTPQVVRVEQRVA
jgi:tRNA(Ile)-lysidine synthase